MACRKCGYEDQRESIIKGVPLCQVCKLFVPPGVEEFERYISEKIDWKAIDSFRNPGSTKTKQIEGMRKKAAEGTLVARPPMGYDVKNGNLIPNEDSAKVHSLFKTFIYRKYSLNSLSKNFGLSVNGTKKILSNRTYLGEIKFDGRIYKGNHKPLVSPEVFYAAQRKLKTLLKPRAIYN